MLFNVFEQLIKLLLLLLLFVFKWFKFFKLDEDVDDDDADDDELLFWLLPADELWLFRPLKKERLIDYLLT